MIQFPCLCGARFSLPDEMAGESFQCKSCGRLVGVPTLDDLARLNADGTYDLDAPFEPDNAPDLSPALPPRYDPFTGELIRAVGVDEFVPSEVAKLPPRAPPVNKSRRQIQPPPDYLLSDTLRRLFNLTSTVVILGIAAANVLFAHWLLLLNPFHPAIFFLAPAVLYLLLTILGEYALIVYHIGPEERDELPSLVSRLNFQEDLWEPFVQMFFSLLSCFALPVATFLLIGSSLPGQLTSLALLAAGWAIFPAFLLTAVTDGTLANFRPRCLFIVMRKAGSAYPAILVCLGFGGFLYAGAMVHLIAGFFYLYSDHSTIPTQWFVPRTTRLTYMNLLISVYLLHYGCWLLGLIWRKHYADFGWIGQRFEQSAKRPGTHNDVQAIIK